MILQILTLLGALGMFLYGMNMMSAGLQKAAGNKLRTILSSMTSNPAKGVLTGLGITAVIQSSSATTVMVVGFVNAGLLTLFQAVGVIMGANIGTTMTAWIISIFGLKMDISVLSIPLMALGFIYSISKKDQHRNIGEFIIGFALLFMGLSFMKESVPDLKSSPEVLSFIQSWTNYGFGSVLIFTLIGTILTLVLQSSSATMALTLVMLSLGWIPFSMAAAMVLGENIGTTITANIAASMANPAAKRAALTHTIFNLFGVIWALSLFTPFTRLIGGIVEAMGLPNPAMNAFEVSSSQGPEATAALYGLSMFHTLFNTINTLLLVWFIPQMVSIVTKLVKEPLKKEDELYKIKFITAGHGANAEIAIEQALKETEHFAHISKRGLDYALSAIKAISEEEFEIYRQKLVKYEEIADRIEREIAGYLSDLPVADLSADTSHRMRSLYKVVGELESLGDSGESIGRILARKNSHDKQFSEQQLRNLELLTAEVARAYDVMIVNLQKYNLSGASAVDISAAENAEARINEVRNRLREEEVYRIEHKTDYLTSVYYLDVVSELEKMGDFIINISQALV
ncbi:MAG: Na/Pi cotransporter family protein [Bacteroidales bacterium]|nr:Na/Pi cotransporter family protein [Bacteroidales bacterium]